MAKGAATKMNKKGTPFQLESGEWCVKIPNEVIERNQKKWEPFIVGQFNGNLPSKEALYAILNGIWSSKKRDITVSKLGPKTVLIRVPCPVTRRRVLLQGIWQIEGQTMFVADYSPGVSPAMPVLVEAPVWLEFRGVPPQFFNEESLERVAGIVGDPLYLHPSTANLLELEVAKVFTVINLSEPLPEAVNAQFESGEIVRVGVSCPWLPPTCTFCKETGHTLRRCPSAPITCTSCNSTTHATDLCPRAKKETQSDNSGSEEKKNAKEGVDDNTNLASASKKNQKKKKKANKKNKEKLAKETPVKDTPKAAEDYLEDPPSSSRKGNKKSVSERKKKKKKREVSSSDSELSPTSASKSLGSEHQHESSSSESESEPEDIAPVEDQIVTKEYTQVLSKKQKRLLSKRMGKHPKPTKH